MDASKTEKYDLFGRFVKFLFGLETSASNLTGTPASNDIQPPFGPIYSLGPVELKTLNTYIEANLDSGSLIN